MKKVLIIAGCLLVLIIGLLVTIAKSDIKPKQIVGKSMAPAYKDGMYLLTKYNYKESELKRGAVVIYTNKSNNTENIKRVVGLPTEKIMIKNKRVFINGQELNENYLLANTVTLGGSFIKEDQEVIIPDKSYVVMGDNREFSNDSRTVGFIDQKDILGIVGRCYRNCN